MADRRNPPFGWVRYALPHRMLQHQIAYHDRDYTYDDFRSVVVAPQKPRLAIEEKMLISLPCVGRYAGKCGLSTPSETSVQVMSSRKSKAGSAK